MPKWKTNFDFGLYLDIPSSNARYSVTQFLIQEYSDSQY